eukprot:COSAG02_NODE_35_length_49339_cov_20.375102_47_plen_69_part_00
MLGITHFKNGRNMLSVSESESNQLHYLWYCAFELTCFPSGYLAPHLTCSPRGARRRPSLARTLLLRGK